MNIRRLRRRALHTPPPAPGPPPTREDLEVSLRYVARLRSMQPSAGTLADLDRQEADLRSQLAELKDRGPRRAEPGTRRGPVNWRAQPAE